MTFKTNKKTIIYLINIFIFIYIFCNPFYNSYASSTGDIYLHSNKNLLEKGEEIEITINLENNKTGAFTSNLYFDNNKLEYISGPENTNIIENRIIFVWYDKEGGNNAKQGELAKFKFKAKEEGIANFVIEGEFFNKIGQLIQTNFNQTQIEIGDIKIEKTINTDLTNTNLETLAIENILLYPAFDNNITKYKAEMPNEIDNLNILAIPENEKAKAEIIGKDTIQEGDNIININVTAADGITKKTYEINIYKRNEEEEIKYQEEQKDNQEKLEEIYEKQKTDNQIQNETQSETESKNVYENNEEKQDKKLVIIIIITIIIILVIALILQYFQKKTTQR